MGEHPEWVAVGAEVRMVRTLGSGRIDHERVGTVTRQTKTQVIVDGVYRFKRFERYGKVHYVEVPRYMHTTTTLKPKESTDG